jgi:hypothetical protein
MVVTDGGRFGGYGLYLVKGNRRLPHGSHKVIFGRASSNCRA